MTTYYNTIPSLDARIHASQLVIIGVVGELVGTDSESYEGKEYVRSRFDVRVEEVLKGDRRQDHVAVQVLGGEAGEAHTDMQLQLREGQRMVLMLAAGEHEDVFVPYLGSAYPVQDAQIDLGEHRVDILVSDATADLTALSVEDLRAVVEQAEQRSVESAEQHDELPPVTEIPSGAVSGGQSGSPLPEVPTDQGVSS